MGADVVDGAESGAGLDRSQVFDHLEHREGTRAGPDPTEGDTGATVLDRRERVERRQRPQVVDGVERFVAA